jgi:hypothetical protein
MALQMKNLKAWTLQGIQKMIWLHIKLVNLFSRPEYNTPYHKLSMHAFSTAYK